MGTYLGLGLKQLAANRGLAAVLALGIVVAAVLLASAPIYSRAMADEGLTFTIQNDLRGNANSRIEFFNQPLTTAEGIDRRQAIERRIDERIGWFRASQSRIFRLGHYPIATPGQPLASRPPFAEPVSLSGYASHVRVLEGTLPATTDGRIIEVAMSQRAVSVSNLKVGDVFDIRDQFDNCERELPVETFPPPPPPCPIVAAATFTFQGKLTAIVEPLDEKEAFWVGTSGRYFDPFNLPIEGSGPVLPMFMDEATLFEGFGKLYPGYRVYSAWLVAANPEVLTRANFTRARDDLVALYAEFEPLGGFAVSPLRDTLIRFDRTADYQQTPLAVLLLEITGIALFYVGLVAAIVVERQGSEIALLRGRGASLLQIISLYLVQGLILGIPTLFLAPFVAGGLTAVLGLTPIFSDVTDGSLLSVTIVPLSFAMAAGGVALSLVALVLPAVVAAVRGSTGVRRAQARPGFSFFQRYYLDVALAAAAILLLFELRERGSVFSPSSTGGVTSDPLLLASPALAMVAAGALILRFYPMILRAVARATTTVSGAAFSLGLAQVVRNPGQYTRLTLLLMMAVAVGTFAASYTTTADRSYRDRANYEAGVDLRATSASIGGTSSANQPVIEREGAALPGVSQASAVLRVQASLATPGSTLSSYQVLALDPKAGASMLWSRDDFASEPLEDILANIGGLPTVPGKVLPATASALSIWARSDETLGGITLRAGIRDSAGHYALIELADLSTTNAQWAHFTGTLKDLPFAPVPPLSIVSLGFSGVSTRPVVPVAFLDDLGAIDESGAVTIIDDFEAALQWSVLPTAGATTDKLTELKDNVYRGNGALKFAFRPGSSDEARGFYVTGFLTPIPAVVSDSFLDATGASIGGVVLLKIGQALVPTQIRATFELFPSTHTRDGPVIVFNRDRLLQWAEMASGGFGSNLGVNELWLSLQPDADMEKIAEALNAPPFSLDQITSRSQALVTNTRNPLIAASGSGILYLAFGAVLVLVASALLTSLLASIRRRRVEFAVIRAIGLSRFQLLSMLVLEYSVVFVVGVSAGCVLGLFVSQRMLSFLNVTEAGERVEPAFIVQTEWLLVAAGVFVVFVVFWSALWLAARIVGRTADAAALRTE